MKKTFKKKKLNIFFGKGNEGDQIKTNIRHISGKNTELEKYFFSLEMKMFFFGMVFYLQN